MEFLKKELHYLPFSRYSIKSIRCGYNGIVILLINGDVYSTGDNMLGDLGLPIKKCYFTFEKIILNEKINEISIGWTHMLLLNEDGHVFSCGSNEFGQTGLESSNHFNIFLNPSKLKVKNISHIYCSKESSYLLNKKGEVLSFGNNNNGRLGLSHQNHVSKPTLIPKKIFNYQKVIDIITSNSSEFVFFKVQGNEYYCAGYNKKGNLGLDHYNHVSIPCKFIAFNFAKNIDHISIGGSHTLVLTKDHEVFSFGENSVGKLGLNLRKNQLSYTNRYQKIKYFNDKNIVKVIASGDNSFFISANGDLYSCGYCSNTINGTRVVYIPTKSKIRDVVIIETGWNHIVYFTKKYELIRSGNCEVGQLGIGKGIKNFNAFKYLNELLNKCKLKENLYKSNVTLTYVNLLIKFS